MSASSNGTSVEVSGWGPAFLIAVGGAVTPNLVIYGALADSLSANPDVKINGSIVGTGQGDSDAGVVGFGGGICYYVQPSNMFLATTLLLSRLVIHDSNGNKAGESNLGITAEGQIGKEWWVSDNWGLGISGQLLLGAMKDKGVSGSTLDTPTWTSRALSLLFSATYN